MEVQTDSISLLKNSSKMVLKVVLCLQRDSLKRKVVFSVRLYTPGGWVLVRWDTSGCRGGTTCFKSVHGKAAKRERNGRSPYFSAELKLN
jgi:hypothetical protein